MCLLQRAGQRSGMDPRHASMVDVVAWSWNLLPLPSRELLKRLTPFVDGFDTDTVLAMAATDETSALQALDEAVQHSLVLLEPTADDALRLRLPEPVREFVVGQLDAPMACQLRHEVRAHWAAWTARLGTTPELSGVRRERSNLLAALASAVADGKPAEGVGLLVALGPALEFVGLPAHSYRLLQQAVAACDDALLAARGLWVLALSALDLGLRAEAEDQADRALAMLPAGAAERCRALFVLAYVSWTVRRDPVVVLPWLDEADALAQAAGDQAWRASVLAVRTYSQHMSRGERDVARPLFERNLALREQAGNRRSVRNARYHLANLWFAMGRLDEAARGYRQVRDEARAADDPYRFWIAGDALGGVQVRRRDWPGSLRAYGEAAEAAWAEGNRFGWLHSLWNSTQVLAHLREPEAAQRLMGYVAAAWARDLGDLTPADHRYIQRVGRLASRCLGAEAAAAAAREWVDRTPRQAMRGFRAAVEAARNRG